MFGSCKIGSFKGGGGGGEGERGLSRTLLVCIDIPRHKRDEEKIQTKKVKREGGKEGSQRRKRTTTDLENSSYKHKGSSLAVFRKSDYLFRQGISLQEKKKREQPATVT